MRVEHILKEKGGRVVTTHPDETIEATARLLTENRIGAVVVCGTGGKVIGVISERDIVRGIALHGKGALSMRVHELMTGAVVICTPQDSLKKLMEMMTAHRIRHLPVIDNDELSGIISIGDVVKHRIEETEMEVGVLRDYVMTAR